MATSRNLVDREAEKKVLCALGLAALLLWWRSHHPLVVNGAGIFLALILLGLIFDHPAVFKPVRVWMRVFAMLGTGLSNLLLATVYIVFIVPYSYMYRWVHKDKVRAFLNGPTKTSAYCDASPSEFAPDTFEKTW